MRILIIVFTIIFLPASSFSAWNAWVDDSLTKYRQQGEDGTSGGQSVTIKAAKNEFESFQVLVHADGEALTGVDLSVSNFVKGTDTVDFIYIYKQHYVLCDTESRPDYQDNLGMVPDALLPKVDMLYNEPRTTFPVSVASGDIQGFWIDVATDLSTVPGTYTATATLSADGKDDITFPITLEVFDFSLPSTTNFPAPYGITGAYTVYGHGFEIDKLSPVSVTTLQQYEKLFLYYRLELKYNDGTQYPPTHTWDAGTKTLTLGSTDNLFDVLRPAMEGTLITSGPMSGAKFPVYEFQQYWQYLLDSDSNIANEDKATANQQYIQQMYDAFEAEGWDAFNTFYTRVRDEPNCTVNVTYRGETMTACEEARLQGIDAHAIDTGREGELFWHVETHSNIAQEGLTDFEDYGFYSPWLTNAFCKAWDKDCSMVPPSAPRELYKDEPFWPYMGCGNNGCGRNDLSDYDGQVDYSVEADGILARLPSFLEYVSESSGTYFWQIVALNTTNDPYFNMWSAEFASNGDGALVYAGVPTKTGRTWTSYVDHIHTPEIGGTHDIPIASIRLMQIRDAQDDLEYFKLAEDATDRDTVLAIVNTVFTNADPHQCYWNLNMDPTVLQDARDSIAAIITGSAGGCDNCVELTGPGNATLDGQGRVDLN